MTKVKKRFENFEKVKIKISKGESGLSTRVTTSLRINNS